MARNDNVKTIAQIWASSPQAEANLNVRQGESPIVFTDGYEETYAENDGQKKTREQENWFNRLLTSIAVEINTRGVGLEWDSTIGYVHPALIIGSDAVVYLSVQDSTNVDPTTDSDNSHWTRLVPVAVAVPQATESVSGTVERASNSEADTGTDDTRYMTPADTRRVADARVGALAPASRLLPATDGTAGQFLGHDGEYANLPAQPDASATVKGITEYATTAEVQSGESDKSVTPSELPIRRVYTYTSTQTVPTTGFTARSLVLQYEA